MVLNFAFEFSMFILYDFEYAKINGFGKGNSIQYVKS